MEELRVTAEASKQQLKALQRTLRISLQVVNELLRQLDEIAEPEEAERNDSNRYTEAAAQ